MFAVSRQGVHQTFVHPDFIRGRVDLLSKLERRKSVAERGAEYKQSKEIGLLREQLSAQITQIEALRAQSAEVMERNRILLEENRRFKQSLGIMANKANDPPSGYKPGATISHAGSADPTKSGILPLFSLVSHPSKGEAEGRKRGRGETALRSSLPMRPDTGATALLTGQGLPTRPADSASFSFALDDQADWIVPFDSAQLDIQASLQTLAEDGDNDIGNKRYHPAFSVSGFVSPRHWKGHEER